jgi:hypothetical protein
MARFLVFALVGAFSVAGSRGLAFGQTAHPQPRSKSQAKKPRPPAPPGKRPPSKAAPQAKKSPTHATRGQRPVGPRGKSPRLTRKGLAKGGKGAKGGAGNYSFDDYKRDLDKGLKEQRDGILEELPADLKIIGGAVSGARGGPEGAALGAGGAAIANAPQLLHGKYLQGKGLWDGLSATERFLGARVSDTFKSNRPPTHPKNDAQKSNQRPTRPGVGPGR